MTSPLSKEAYAQRLQAALYGPPMTPAERREFEAMIARQKAKDDAEREAKNGR